MSEQSAPPLPTPEQIRAAIALLEPHGAHPTTGALHDPLYLLLQDGDIALLNQVRGALLDHGDHPAAGAIRRVLGPSVALPPRTLALVLDQHGPWTQDDPLDELAYRLQRAADQQAALLQRLEQQSEEIVRLSRTADALALAGAILALLALAGWLGALDLWTIDWMSPPVPPPHGIAQDQKP